MLFRFNSHRGRSHKLSFGKLYHVRFLSFTLISLIIHHCFSLSIFFTWKPSFWFRLEERELKIELGKDEWEPIWTCFWVFFFAHNLGVFSHLGKRERERERECNFWTWVWFGIGGDNREEEEEVHEKMSLEAMAVCGRF